MRGIYIAIFLGFILILALSCRTSEISLPAASTPTPISETAPLWQKQLDSSLQEAKKEGRLLIYSTAGSDVRAMITKRFKDKFGLSVEFIVGRGEEIAQRLMTERKAGLYLGDLYFSGSTTATNFLKPNNMVEPIRPYLISPEITNPANWFDRRLPFIDRDELIFAIRLGPSTPMAINTMLVRKNEIVSYKDLLTPRWKGKIVINDPTVAGTGLRWFSMIGYRILNLDYMYDFVKLEPVVIRDQRLQMDWLANGRYALAIAPRTDVISEYMRAGAPLEDVTPIEGTYLTSGAGNIAVFSKPPHPNTLKVFINWFLTKEIQHEYSKLVLAQSAREDVPTDHLGPLDIRITGHKYLNGEDEEFLLRQPEHLKKAQEIFGPLVR